MKKSRGPIHVAGDADFNDGCVVDFDNGYANTIEGSYWMQHKNAAGTDLEVSNIRTVFWVMRGANNLLCSNNNSDFHRHRGADGLTMGYTSCSIGENE